MRWRGLALLAVLTCLGLPVQARDGAAVEVGVVGSHAEKFARLFQQPFGAYLTWRATNPESSAVPTYADLAPHMFMPSATPEYLVTVSALSPSEHRVCMVVRVDSRQEAAGLAASAARARAALGDVNCNPDNGASLTQKSLPLYAGLVRTVDKTKILAVPNLPSQPIVGLTTAGIVDLTASAPTAAVTITNNTAGALLLQQAVAADPDFMLGSSCQAGVDPGAACELEIAYAKPLTTKRISRVTLTFSNGAIANFSVRAKPQ